MPNQIRSQNQLSNKDIETKRLPQEYFIEKSQTGSGDGDFQTQQAIWSFLKSVPELDISEVEVDVSNGVVTIMGTFPSAQQQGHIIHFIMNNVPGVAKVVDQTHILHHHTLKNSPDET